MALPTQFSAAAPGPGQPLRIVLIGAQGRMGRAIQGLIANDPTLVLTGTMDAADPAPESTAIAGAAAVIDFSHASITALVAEACAGAGVPLVSGTTGVDADSEARVATAAQRIPIVRAANTSLGVTLLAAFVRQAAQALPGSFEPEILELHHSRKQDAPSGTARLLGRAVAEGRGLDLERAAVWARVGTTGERPEGALGFATLRGGDSPGEHTVFFFGEGERIELTHRATDRTIFARGALTAARWLTQPGRGAGLYSMADVLGLAR